MQFEESQAEMAAGILSAGLFLLFHYGLVFPDHLFIGEPALSFILALLSYVGILLVLPKPRTLADELAERASQAGMDGHELARIIRTNHAKIEMIRKINTDIRGQPHEQIERIAAAGERIIQRFKEDPDDVRRSRHFLHHYLNATVDIVSQYRELTRRGTGQRVHAVLDKTEETLAEIEDIFRQQYERNLDNEALSLDVALDVLRKMMKKEGL